MKIAFYYTGYMRTWELCKPNQYENLITSDSELYFYTYTHENPHFQEHDNQYYFQRIHQPYFHDPFGKHRFQERKAGENQVLNTLNMWINMFVGFNLIPDRYDVIVRCRTDLKFNGKLDFSQFTYDKNTVYIPKGADFGGINDQFAFGSHAAMKKYFSVLLNHGSLWHDGVLFHSESMLLANLNYENVNIIRLEHPQHDIQR